MWAVLFVFFVVGGPDRSAGAAASTIPTIPPDLLALDYAFRFGSAIDADPKDKAKAQEAVVRDYAALGALDEALTRAERIEGWRQGVIFADLAGQLVRAGRTEEARELVGRAEGIRTGIQSWQNPRIAAHIAQSLALLGDVDESRRIAMELIAYDGQQYAGRSVAVIAAGYAARGRFEDAMAEVNRLEGTEDLYDNWWRTVGLIGVARESGLSDDQRFLALQEARETAAGVDGWKRAEALAGIAEEYARLGKRKPARQTLKEAEGFVVSLNDRLSVKAILLANLARAWAAAGERDRARSLLERAEPLVSNAMDIERPGVWAGIAEGYAAAGDEADARRVYESALAAAESLVNARPRALAVVAVCRSMSRSAGTFDERAAARLEALYEGLGEPW
jgi:tetratricopeptide (TPR) repeat protein